MAVVVRTLLGRKCKTGCTDVQTYPVRVALHPLPRASESPGCCLNNIVGLISGIRLSRSGVDPGIRTVLKLSGNPDAGPDSEAAKEIIVSNQLGCLSNLGPSWPLPRWLLSPCMLGTHWTSFLPISFRPRVATRALVGLLRDGVSGPGLRFG